MEAATPEWMETIDHTADTGVVVRAAGVEELFERAALGMFHLIADLSGVRPARTVQVTVAAPDREALLVRWLSELNFLHQTENILFVEFNVKEYTDTALKAAARGEPVAAGRHHVHTEIKAVTFHDLHVEQKGEAWEARVLFDV
jgi:SHS2 domain-containing protein